MMRDYPPCRDLEEVTASVALLQLAANQMFAYTRCDLEVQLKIPGISRFGPNRPAADMEGIGEFDF